MPNALDAEALFIALIRLELSEDAGECDIDYDRGRGLRRP